MFVLLVAFAIIYGLKLSMFSRSEAFIISELVKPRPLDVNSTAQFSRCVVGLFPWVLIVATIHFLASLGESSLVKDKAVLRDVLCTLMLTIIELAGSVSSSDVWCNSCNCICSCPLCRSEVLVPAGLFLMLGRIRLIRPHSLSNLSHFTSKGHQMPSLSAARLK